MSNEFQCISPIDGELVVTCSFSSEKQVKSDLEVAVAAQKHWAKIGVGKRIDICEKAIAVLLSQQEDIAREITLQMGRPLRHAMGEVNGVQDRANYLMSVAEEQLQTVQLPETPNFIRYIKREPLGVMFCMAPWNYPYLTAINSIIPALLAGNSVILKHSPQTPLCAERLVNAFLEAGCPQRVFQLMHLRDADTSMLIGSDDVAIVNFTGSVRVGRLVEQQVSGHFKQTQLEMGGKDAAYVRQDAKINYAVESLVEGAFFNAGQSCCAIERIYVHDKVYDDFVALYIEETKRLRLGNPLDEDTTLGPVVNLEAAERIREQIALAVEAGAVACLTDADFPMAEEGTTYLAPQILLDADRTMDIMKEETFGPVVTISKVSGDAEAIKQMNDSQYGLTASIWSDDLSKSEAIGDQLDVGTVFMNRCDYLDPELPWIGVKQSGKGFSLSRYTFDRLTRPKSYHLKQLN